MPRLGPLQPVTIKEPILAGQLIFLVVDARSKFWLLLYHLLILVAN